MTTAAVFTAVLSAGIFLSQPKANTTDLALRPEQRITVGGKIERNPTKDPQIKGALITLERKLSEYGMHIHDYEKIEIVQLPDLILVSAANLSKLSEEEFDYLHAITSIEYAFQAALNSRTFEILPLRSPEGMKFK